MITFVVVISEGIESCQQLRDDITENNAYRIMILDLRGMKDRRES